MGVGGKEIQQMLTLLDLHQGKHYGANALGRVEEDVGSVLRQATNKCMKEVIELEIKMLLDKKHKEWVLLENINESMASEEPLICEKWKGLDDDAKPR
eukprot:13731956-Ditylum_brightwellii.AAC.1